MERNIIMINKFSVFLLLVLSLDSFSSPLVAQPTLDDFKKEYSEYQKYSEEGKRRESLPYAHSSYEIGKSLFEELSKNTASLAYNYGLNLMELRNDEDAEKVFREALKMYESVYGKESEQLIPVLMDLGHSMAAPHQKTAQKRYYNRALDLAGDNYGEDSINWGQRSVEAGVEMLSKARSTEAKKYLYQGHKVLEGKLGEAAPRVGYAAFQIGKFELATKDYDDAIVYFNKALASFSLPEQPSNRIELATHGFLVQAYEKIEQQDLATKHCLAIGRMTPVASVQDYQPLVKVAPKYPMSALRQKKEGYVTLEFDVDDFGFVRNPKVVDISGPGSFAKVAVEAAKKFRYAPGFENGKPVTTVGVKNRFIFEIAK